MEQIESQSNGGQKLAAVLIGTLGSGLLFSASLAVPVIGFVSAFLAPVPLGLARTRVVVPLQDSARYWPPCCWQYCFHHQLVHGMRSSAV